MKTSLKSFHSSLVIALGALLATLPAAYAVDTAAPSAPPSPEARHERMEKAGDHMAEELGLTDDQKAKWKALGAQEKSELDALRADPSVAKEDRRAKAGEIHKKYRAQREAILTPEQKSKADKMHERMEKRLEERHEKGGDKPVQH